MSRKGNGNKNNAGEIQVLREELSHAKKSINALATIASRAAVAAKLGYSFGGDRDLYTALGYTKVLQYEHYYARYDRQDIAKAVIDRTVEDSWRQLPQISDGTEKTVFTEAWETMVKKNKVFHYMQRLDRVASIGKYGVLVLGLNDGGDMGAPVDRAGELLYLMPYTEVSSKIVEWDHDEKSLRFGKPNFYQITVSIDDDSFSVNKKTHHSRILHVVEDALDSDIVGIPGLKAIYNRLEDLEKVMGSSGEMFWRGARKEFALEADKDADLSAQALADLKDEVEAFVHEAQTFLRLQGIKTNKISPEVADPRSHVDVNLDVICATKGIPKAILLGSARGEAGAQQYEEDWARRCDVRRAQYNEPQILRPFIDRMIELGVLPSPSSGEYSVVWPDLLSASDKDKADISRLRSVALQAYANARMSGLNMPLATFLREVMWFKNSQIEKIEADTGQSVLELESSWQDFIASKPNGIPKNANGQGIPSFDGEIDRDE